MILSVKQRVVRFLAALTAVVGLTVLDEVITTEAVHAQTIPTYSRELLVMRKCFEFSTGVEWVFVFADNTLLRIDVSYK